MLILSLFGIRNLFRLIYYFSLLPLLIDLVNKDYHLLTLTIWQGLSGRVFSASDCGVRGPRFETRRGQLCLSRRLL